MFRNLFVLVAIALVVMVARRYLTAGSSGTPKQEKNENTVQCDECQAYIAENQAIESQGKHFCSQKHLKAWQARQ